MNNPIEQIHEMNELSDAIEKIRHLDEQIRQPDRDGMIKALSEAQSIAITEIAITQIQQGAKYKLWKDFTDEELYNMLLPYRQGLCQHCIIKFGEKAVKELLDSTRQQ